MEPQDKLTQGRRGAVLPLGQEGRQRDGVTGGRAKKLECFGDDWENVKFL